MWDQAYGKWSPKNAPKTVKGHPIQAIRILSWVYAPLKGDNADILKEIARILIYFCMLFRRERNIKIKKLQQKQRATVCVFERV